MDTNTMYPGRVAYSRRTRRDWRDYSASSSSDSSRSRSPSPSLPPSWTSSAPRYTYLELEDRTNARGRFSPGTAVPKQQPKPFRPGKRLRGPLKHKGAILRWFVFAVATTACWLYLFLFQPSPDAVEYGFKATANGTCEDLESPGTTKGMFLFLVNGGTSAVAAIVAYFRIGLLAPSPRAYEKSEGSLYLGVESGRGFLKASWYRQALYLVLLFASLPLFFLTNSLVYTMYPAYNTYEVLVSTTFFDGKPFDLAGVNMTRYASLKETPTMPSLDLQWPEEYGASDQLNRSLAGLQLEPALWKNLSRADCVEQFNDALYAKYRTLVLVTDYDSGNDSESDSLNSALAASVLPGYRLKSAGSSLVAICPDKYLEAYKNTRHPSETPFLELLWQGASETNMAFLSPAEAHEWATNGSLPSDVSVNRLGRRGMIPYSEVPKEPFNPMPGQDLCYHYWADDDRWMSDSPRIYRVPQCRLQYCLAEPVEAPRMCQVLYSPRVLFILSVFLSCLLAVISIALVLRCAQDGLYDMEEASEYYRHQDPRDRPSWREEFYGDHRDDYSMFSHRRLPRHLFIMSLGVFAYVWVLWANAGTSKGNVNYPSSPQDESWLFKALALNKTLHVIFEVQHYFQDADVEKRAFRVQFDLNYHDPQTESLWQRVKRKARSSSRGLFLSTRTFLVHFTYGLIFITQLMGVAPLEEAAGTLVDAKPFAFTTIGVPDFNLRLVNFTIFFGLFNWLVFVLFPSTLLDLTFYATTSFSIEKNERVGSASTLIFAILTRPIMKLFGVKGRGVLEN